ncbi:ABC-F family ATP-binding cassette domain-containing protein [Loigolactobacillus bifermentans]|uniref:ABC transporter, ATP-binding protein n=1 Tax=Loigolactobacillus bifermentans DSM 20003 TaxID=1423726 RepID=A0A0R1H9G1_9LACO|nr:ABC-F family ATP-binding cassette domain-containing protein [Loigolactobacillus bifermentans]KRK40218.1 ABC transporter, ATP-binding protein [Loigolactobacillus bifermentans DSM 20003]QGG61692.1 ATP-binding cassette domain-containing protein [Loigolactobacillus bifermentans]
MILLQAQNITRRFGGEVLFEHVHLEVQSKARVALVGRNGIGKSTLLKILVDENPPDVGQVIYGKNASIGYLPQNSGLDSQKTVFDEMLTVFKSLQDMEQKMHELEAKLGDPDLIANDEAYQATLKHYDQLQHDFSDQNGYGYQAEIRTVLHGFGFGEDYFERPINALSGGQRSRLAIARLLLEKHDLLILDEPTNHLDIDTMTWLEDYLQNYSGALLIVSHDQYFLDKVTTEVYDMSQHTTTHYRGNYTAYREQKAANLASAWKAYEKQQAEINKLEDFVNKNLVRASTTKRAQSRRKQLEKMDRLEKPINDNKTVRFHFSEDKQSGNQVLDVNDAAVGYSADQVLSEPINLHVKRQEAVAITGPNGVGKSTLLKSILGMIPFLKGSAQLGTGVDIGYYDQEQATLNRKKTVLAEIWDEHPLLPEGDIRQILGSFLFTGNDVEKSVAALSGGEKAQLMLVKLAMNHNNFLILDEPTNHLDIDSKEVLESALIDFDGTILFVSHDRYFMNRIATKVIELSDQGTKLYLGGYDYYVDKKAEETAIAAAKAAEQPIEVAQPSTSAQSYQDSKATQKQQRKLQRDIAALEDQLSALEQQSHDLQVQMTQPDTLQDPAALTDLQKQVDAVDAEQAAVEAQWEAQSLALEELES